MTTALARFNATVWAYDVTAASRQLAAEIGPIGYPRVISDTTGALTADDNLGWVQCTSASPVTLTYPAGLGPFSCYIVQMGAGTVTLSASGTTINNRQSRVASAGQYAVMSLVATSPNVAVLGGDTA